MARRGEWVSKASVTPGVKAEDVLRHLVVSLGQEAEKRGIVEEEDPDGIVAEVQQKVYQEHNGRSEESVYEAGALPE